MIPTSRPRSYLLLYDVFLAGSMRLIIQLPVVIIVLVLIAVSVRASLVPSLRVYAADDPDCTRPPVSEVVLPQSCTKGSDGRYEYYACAPIGRYVSAEVVIHNVTNESGDRQCSRLRPFPEEYVTNECQQDIEEPSVMWICSNSGVGQFVSGVIVSVLALLSFVRL
jgi:hypothetical protein